MGAQFQKHRDSVYLPFGCCADCHYFCTVRILLFVWPNSHPYSPYLNIKRIDKAYIKYRNKKNLYLSEGYSPYHRQELPAEPTCLQFCRKSYLTHPSSRGDVYISFFSLLANGFVAPSIVVPHPFCLLFEGWRL